MTHNDGILCAVKYVFYILDIIYAKLSIIEYNLYFINPYPVETLKIRWKGTMMNLNIKQHKWFSSFLYTITICYFKRIQHLESAYMQAVNTNDLKCIRNLKFTYEVPEIPNWLQSCYRTFRISEYLLILKLSEVCKTKAGNWIASETKHYFHFQQWLQTGKVF